MDRKWTPGPWTISTENDVCTQIDGEYHAVCTDQFCYSSDDEKKANAHLIAAAPDLYEALQVMVDYCNAECGSKIYPGHQANQALAKARGEAQ